MPPGGLAAPGQVDPNVPQLPPLPPGVYPVLDAGKLQNDILNLQRAGLPFDQQKADLDLINKGFMRYSDGTTRPYEGGIEDPQVKSRQARSSAYGQAAGGAAPGFTHMVLNGVAMDVPTPFAEKLFQNQFGGPPGATPAPGAPAPGTTAGGSAPPAGVTPGGAPVPAQPVIGGTPVKPQGYDEAMPRLNTVLNEATSSQNDLGTIQAIRSILAGAPGDPKLVTGWLAQARADLANKLSTLGVTDTSALNNASSAQELHKLTLQLASSAASRAGRGQESVLSTFLDAYPSIETRPDALDLMTNVFQMNALRAQDRRNAVLQAWGTGGDLVKSEAQAEADFDRTHPAANYFRAAEIQSKGAAARTWSQVRGPQQLAAIKQLVPAGNTWYDQNGNPRLRGGAPTSVTPGGGG